MFGWFYRREATSTRGNVRPAGNVNVLATHRQITTTAVVTSPSPSRSFVVNDKRLTAGVSSRGILRTRPQYLTCYAQSVCYLIKCYMYLFYLTLCAFI